MEDENSIELRLGLGLGCGGSSSKSKGVASDSNVAEGSKNKEISGNLNVSDVAFGQFFLTSVDSQDQVGQRCDSFWTNLGKQSSQETDEPVYCKLWNSNDATDVVEEEFGLSKRKMPFEDTNLQKKPQKENLIDGHGKSPHKVTLKSHVSINREDCSPAENEGVVESQAAGLSSWLVSKHEEHGKGSDAPKEANSQHGRMTSELPTKVANVACAHNAMGLPLHSVMQLKPLGDDNQSKVQTVTGNLQLAFGYPSAQLPSLESGSSWMLGCRTPGMPSLDRMTRDGMPRAAQPGNDPKAFHAVTQASNSSAASPAFEGKILDLTKGSDKHAKEVVKNPTHQIEEANGNRSILKSNDTSNLPIVGLLEDSTIKPGVVPGLKFGGTGSCPDLPWVSTTGLSGKTISGVTYKFSKDQIKIVCACHGSHLTPEEFIQHANADTLDT